MYICVLCDIYIYVHIHLFCFLVFSFLVKGGGEGGWASQAESPGSPASETLDWRVSDLGGSFGVWGFETPEP